jgi:hypothetical protein
MIVLKVAIAARDRVAVPQLVVGRVVGLVICHETGMTAAIGLQAICSHLGC